MRDKPAQCVGHMHDVRVGEHQVFRREILRCRRDALLDRPQLAGPARRQWRAAHNGEPILLGDCRCGLSRNVCRTVAAVIVDQDQRECRVVLRQQRRHALRDVLSLVARRHDDRDAGRHPGMRWICIIALTAEPKSPAREHEVDPDGERQRREEKGDHRRHLRRGGAACPAMQKPAGNNGLWHPFAGVIGVRSLTSQARYRLRWTPQPADFLGRNTGPHMNDLTDAGAMFRQRLDGAAADIERVLERLLDDTPLTEERARPKRLMDAMRYVSLAGGKRLRPFLVVETAALFKAPRERALMAGAALEFVHCYSLAHDDLPAMDNDDLRRGRPTAHRQFDEATAILAGDGLLTLAFDVLAREETHPNPAVRIALVAALAH